MQTTIGEDGVVRCSWGTSAADYVAYHDTEWGFGVVDDHRLFEKLCLEGFQSGLSWLTILRKRDGFRAAFADFDPTVVAQFDGADVDRLLGDAAIVRHGGKIRSTINNAQRALELIAEHGSLARYFWGWADLADTPPEAVEPHTDTSRRLSKELKKAGWSFVGPTTCYAFMQAMGLVNDHAGGCDLRAPAQRSREAAARSVLG
ncbi:MAG TPA: DNA-3-methyladenine glycosylase I [Microlunatus sp.]|nr:DNA-3-methyladenine glycosylase I [Microlunatus sp.]